MCGCVCVTGLCYQPVTLFRNNIQIHFTKLQEEVQEEHQKANDLHTYRSLGAAEGKKDRHPH